VEQSSVPEGGRRYPTDTGGFADRVSEEAELAPPTNEVGERARP
jgi:hypothetical protein